MLLLSFGQYVQLWQLFLISSNGCREVVEKFPNLRKSITEKLLETFGQIRSGKVFRGALWIVGEYVTELSGMYYFHLNGNNTYR